MDKSILKKFAIESRQDLMNKICNKIKTFYVNEEFKKEQKGEVYLLSNEKHSLSLTKEENEKRDLLIKRIKELTLEQVIEEAAYTWFNRIIAIRYMEINDMLPLTNNNSSLGIRVLSSKDNTPDPEILKFTNLTNPDLDIDFKKEKYIELKDDNEKFKYILLLICKKLGKVIPQVFDGITDYIDILIPDNLLNDAGFITKIINDVPEENYNQVEIIGWLYQYYNQEQKDEVMSSTSAKKIYNKNEVPYVTQLFTPDWIVKYMVENTLGKYSIEHGASRELIKKWKYFINEDIILTEIIKPTEIKFIDPCSGSGHILVYAFELFCQIYESYGYSKKVIPEYILKNNIYGIDIDDRAGQLSVLSLILKAREYDKDIFSKNILNDINVMAIQESNHVDDIIFDEISDIKKRTCLKEEFLNSKDIGSLIRVDKLDFSEIKDYISKTHNIFTIQLKDRVLPLIRQSEILSSKYDVVVTNPPYLSLSVMNKNLKNYVNEYYQNCKYDLFSVFIQVSNQLLKKNGYYAMITPPSIMFLDTFEKTRKYMLENNTICSLIHMGRGVFGIDFGSCSFVMKKEKIADYKSKFFKLHNRTFQLINIEDIEKIYLNSIENNEFKYDFDSYNNSFEEGVSNQGKKIMFLKNQKTFEKLPSTTFSYWLSDKMVLIFNNKNVGNYADVKQGMTTGNNTMFLRYWYEINNTKMGLGLDQDVALLSSFKWFPYNKGGDFRKWYGNNDYVVNYENNGREVKEYTSHLPQGTAVRIKSYDYYFKESATWSFISSNNFGIRYSPKGFIFDVAGSSLFSEKYLIYLLGILSSSMINELLKSLNPTVNFQTKNIKSVPVIINTDYKDEIESIVYKNINIAKYDWDSFETSWDFKKHPLLEFINSISSGLSDNSDSDSEIKIETTKNNYNEIIIREKNKPVNSLISSSFERWKEFCEKNFNQLKLNEEELNRIFIDIYGLQDELTPDVEDKDITIRKADRVREIKSLISYAVGCMFGRYSLDEDGLIYAGGEFDSSKYKIFNADNDNIIPITDEAYFNDDIVTRFKQFIEVVYGKDTLNENLDYIAEALGKRGTETSEDTIRRYFVNDFYNDHIKTYQKRPIYWLFDSGKKNGFKCLIYMHRYSKDLVATIRTKYIPKVQTTYEKLLSDVEYKLSTDLSLADKKEMEKKKIELNGKIQEVKEYYEMIANVANKMIDIDLDDGVVVNYAKFTYLNPKTNKEESILGKIK